MRFDDECGNQLEHQFMLILRSHLSHVVAFEPISDTYGLLVSIYQK